MPKDHENQGHGPEGGRNAAPECHESHGGGHDHGHHVTIIVNGRSKEWTKKEISYEELVEISGLPPPQGPNAGFTITYHSGPGNRPDGSVTIGHSVKVKDGMIFNVTPTNQS